MILWRHLIECCVKKMNVIVDLVNIVDDQEHVQGHVVILDQDHVRLDVDHHHHE